MDCLAGTRCTEITKDDDMNLTFLGTAAAEGYPDPICAYRNCVDSRQEDLDCGTFEAIPFAIENRREAQFFHGTETGASPLDTWSRLTSKRWNFDLFVLDQPDTFDGPGDRITHQDGSPFWLEVAHAESRNDIRQDPYHCEASRASPQHHPRKPAGIHA